MHSCCNSNTVVDTKSYIVDMRVWSLNHLTHLSLRNWENVLSLINTRLHFYLLYDTVFL